MCIVQYRFRVYILLLNTGSGPTCLLSNTGSEYCPIQVQGLHIIVEYRFRAYMFIVQYRFRVLSNIGSGSTCILLNEGSGPAEEPVCC